VTPQPTNPVEVFYSYAHEDEKLRDELKKHLANLKRQKVITDWYDRDISAGKEWDDEIKNHLDFASVILLLISPDFMNSDYSNDVEVKRAMERHEAGEARVIPIVLRPVDWEGAPFSKLQSLPTDVRAITLWENQDEAFLDVTQGIRKAIAELSGPSASIPTLPDIPRPPRVGFISRRDKDGHDILEKLRSELAPHKSQLVALWGPGGVGKTALAAEAVRSHTETSGQRLVWITADARPNFSFSTLLDEIAEQLGRTDLRPLALEAKEEALHRLIATGPTLIILDNLETIAPEEEMLCKNFLAKRAQCPALITTRERIDDAYLILLAAMAPDEAAEYLKRLVAQSPDPDLYRVVDPERILRTAEYNPLIIQWVVAQIDLAQDPEEVLSDLTQGEGDAAQRVFDRSFELKQLDNGGRAVLLALSLFVPSASRKALAEVAGLNKDKDRKRFKDAVRTLSSLWLIRTAHAGERLAVEGLTRQLTEAHLARDPRSKTFRERYVARFLRYAKSHAQPRPEDYDALETEKDNVLSAMEEAVGLKDWVSVTQLMDAIDLDGVVGYLTIRGYWEEAVQRREQALKVATNLSNELLIAHCSHNLAVTYQRRGNLSEARRLLNESLELNKRLGSQEGIAVGLHQLAVLAQDQGDLEEARRLYNESLEIKKLLSDQGLISTSLHQLATLAQDQDKLDEARMLYNESLEIDKKLGNQSGIAISLHHLAWIAQSEGELYEARLLYNESLEISKRLGNQDGIANSLHQLALLAQEQGELDEALHLYQESLTIEKKLGNLRGIAATLYQLGTLAHDQENLDEARQLYTESLKIKKGLGNQDGIAMTLLQLGTLAQDQGEFDEARRLYDESFEIEQRLGNQHSIASCLHQLGRLAEDEDRNAEAAQLFSDALGIFEKLKSPNMEIVHASLERLEGKSK
jgi:tetratricopeptide (TPR) repeat protein